MTRDELMQIGHDAGFDTSELTGEVIALLECVAEHAEAAELRRQNAEIARLTAENRALKAAVSEAVAEERMACAELMEQQHTWITNVAASALIRARDQ